MKIIMIYKDREDYTRTVTDFVADFKRATNYEITEIDPDTKEGDSIVKTYDIVEYPTMIAISDDGILQEMWRGVNFPLISELSYYIQE